MLDRIFHSLNVYHHFLMHACSQVITPLTSLLFAAILLCVVGAVAGPQESPKYVAIILHCLALVLFKISTCPDQLEEENVAKIVKQVLSGGSPDTVDLCNFSIHVKRVPKRTNNPHPI